MTKEEWKEYQDKYHYQLDIRIQADIAYQLTRITDQYQKGLVIIEGIAKRCLECDNAIQRNR